MPKQSKNKHCGDCKQELPSSSFYLDQDGYIRSICKECEKIRTIEWRSKNRERYREQQIKFSQKARAEGRTRAYRLKALYGITEEQYQTLLQEQNGCCAVCKRHHTEFTKRLAVDHDHRTLALRGLLCTFCNRAVIGRHREGRILRAAADYLDKPPTGLIIPKKIRRKKRVTRKRT